MRTYRIRKYLRSKARVRYVEEFIKHCSIGDWFVLYQLSRNMNKRYSVFQTGLSINRDDVSLIK